MAAKRAAESMEERTKKERELRDYLIERVLKEVPYVKIKRRPGKNVFRII